MAQERGWVDPTALRAVYASLPPAQPLVEALAQRGLLNAGQVQALLHELGLAASQATVHLAPQAPGDGTQTLPLGPPPGSGRYPPPGPAGYPQPGAPVQVPPAGTAHWSPAGTAHWSPEGTAHWSPGGPPGGLAAQSAQTLPPQGPPLASSGSGSSMDAATMVGGAPQDLASSGTGALPQPGAVLAGRYGILKVLGQGGMGAVYLADDRQRGTQVALKVMLPGAAGAQALLRFQREAEALAKVDDHIGIVRIRDYGSEGGLPYAALDLIEGGDLHDRVKAEGPLPLEEAARVTAEVARAIHHCHERSILHRDLKPANVMVRTADGAPFVTDFGLAYDAEEESERLTQTGQVMGTPAYMPPEQAEGDKEQIDARSDVYGLGAILYELISGRAPFRGEGMAIIKQVLLDQPQSLSELRAEVPEDLVAIQERAMAKDSALRYQSAAELAADLERHLRGEPITARAPTRAEHLRWRRSQGDKKAWAQFIAIRVLLPLALLVGAIQLVWLTKPLQRARVSSFVAETIPSRLAEGLVFAGKDAATALRLEAGELATNLAALYGVEVDAERPDRTILAAIAEGELEPARAEALRAYALRVQVASGVRPTHPAPASDPEAYTLDLLAHLGFGTPPPEPRECPQPEGQASKSAKEIEAALVRAEREIRDFEEKGWKQLEREALESSPWIGPDLSGALAKRLRHYGGLEPWQEALGARHHAIKDEVVRKVLQGFTQRVREGQYPAPLKSMELVRDHLREAPAVPFAGLREELIALGAAAIHRFNVDEGGLQAAELFSRPILIDQIDWAAAQRRGGVDQRALTKLGNGDLSVPVLILSLRMGLPPKLFLEARIDQNTRKLEAYIAFNEKRGGALAGAYYLLGFLRARQIHASQVDEERPEVLLPLVATYGSALLPGEFPVDPADYPEGAIRLETPTSTLSRGQRVFVVSEILQHLATYEKLLLERHPGQAKAPSVVERRHKFFELAMKWLLREGPGLNLGARADSALRIQRSLVRCTLQASPETRSRLAALCLEMVEDVAEALLVHAEGWKAGQATQEASSLESLDAGLGFDHLERNLSGLVESHYELCQRVDFERTYAFCQKVRDRYKASAGEHGRRILKALVVLTLGNQRNELALEAIAGYLAFLDPNRDKSASDPRIDEAMAWHAQAQLLAKRDIPGAKEIHRRAVAGGGGKQSNWKRSLALIRDAEAGRWPEPPEQRER